MLAEGVDYCAVDHLVQAPCDVGTLCYFAGEGKRGCIEEPPSGAVSPIMRRIFISMEHMCYRLHADDIPPVHLHESMVGLHVSECMRLVR